MNKRYYNIKEISQYTGLPVKTLYDWAGQRKMPSIKVGRRVLFDLNDINSFLTKLKRDVEEHDSIVNKIAGELKANVL